MAVAVRSPEVLEPGEPTLQELATTANREHEAAEGAAESWLDHAVRAGQALLAAQERVPGGEWGSWLEANFAASRWQASRYARAALYEAALQQAGVSTGAQVQAVLAGLPPVRESGWYVKREDARELAISLRAAGMMHREIAKAVGVHVRTVQDWVTPGAAERRAEATARRQRARRTDAARKRQALLDREVRKRGGDAAEAYSLLRRAAQRLDRAIVALDPGEQRGELNKAYRKVTSAEGDVVRALGIAP